MLYLETKEICLCWPVSLCQKSIPHWGFVIIPKFLLYYTFLNVCNPLKWRLRNSEIKEPSCGKSFICWLQKHLKFFFTAKVFCFFVFFFFFPFFPITVAYETLSICWDLNAERQWTLLNFHWETALQECHAITFCCRIQISSIYEYKSQTILQGLS